MDLMPLGSDKFPNPIEVQPIKKIDRTMPPEQEGGAHDQKKDASDKKKEKPEPPHQPLPGGSIDLRA
jgi:hypothetical protein